MAAFSGDPEGVLAARVLRLTGGRGTAPGAVGDYEVVTAQRAGGCAVFSLKGIDTIEAAEPLVKAVVSVRYDELPSLPEDEFYWIDAVGCLVVDESGAPLGEVVAVEPGAAYDYLVVKRPGGRTRTSPWWRRSFARSTRRRGGWSPLRPRGGKGLSRNNVCRYGRRVARPARREEGEYREYSTDEQRSPPG